MANKQTEMEKALKLRADFEEAAKKEAGIVLKQQKLTFEKFKCDEQEALLYRFMENDITPLVGILPTNSGKSLIYQAGARYVNREYGGKTVVVSPLISLMIDQVTNSEKDIEKLLMKQLKNGIICFNSSVRQYEKYWEKAEESFKTGSFTLLYVSPERFRSKNFLRIYKKQNFMRFVIDEAHCVELWGQGFRYEYKNLKNVIGKAKLVLLTASAGDKLINDTLTTLINNDAPVATVIKGEIIRKEISILPAKEVHSDDERLKAIKSQVKKWVLKFDKKEKIIIFTAFATAGRNKCDCTRISEELRNSAEKLGLAESEIDMYSGAMSTEERENVQNKFAKGEVRILVCTKAFGMGVDIKNIYGVIHAYPPVTIEEYYQEIGRGGRNAVPDHPCETLLLWSKNDKKELNFLIRGRWAFRMYANYVLLSSGILLVEEKNDPEYGLECSFDSNKKVLQFVDTTMKREKRNRPKLLIEGAECNEGYYKIFRYDAHALADADNILHKIEKALPEARTKNERNDLRRIARWLNLYCEEKRDKGTFTIPPKNYHEYYSGFICNSIKGDLSYMEEQGWVSRSEADISGGIAKYRILEKDLDDEQVEDFFGKINSQRKIRIESWNAVQKIFKKTSNEEVWTYLKKKL